MPPGCEFRGTDSIAGEIALVQAGEFGFGDFRKMLAVAGVDFFLRPSRYCCCGVLSADPRPDEGCDEFAKLFAVAKPDGLRLPKGLANGGVARG